MSPDPEPPEIAPSALPVETAIAADQAAAHAADRTHHHGPFHTHCENCGTKLEGPYCSKCGQHDFEFHRSFWHVFLEGLESFFHFDSKLFHTVVTLVFRPGRLTKEFNAGKRAAQMPPLRLYIFVSLVFFFLFFLQNKAPEGGFTGANVKPNANVTPEQREELRQAWQQAGQEWAKGGNSERSAEATRAAAEKTQQIVIAPIGGAGAVAQHDAVSAAPQVPQPPRESANAQPEFVRFLLTQGQRLTDPAQQRQMVDSFLHAVPKMLLVSLPFFALYTRFLFRRSGLVYLQHLVLALHFHTLIFLWSMLKDGWVFVGGLASETLAAWIGRLFTAWLLVYPFLMLRELFGNSWAKTTVKTGILFSLYGMTLALVAALGGFLIFAMM